MNDGMEKKDEWFVRMWILCEHPNHNSDPLGCIQCDGRNFYEKMIHLHDVIQRVKLWEALARL